MQNFGGQIRCIQTFYLCEDERKCWIFHELNSLSLVCLMKSFTLPDFAKHEVGHK